MLGLDLASLGPALIQLAVKTSSSLTAVGYCFFFRSLAYLLGQAKWVCSVLNRTRHSLSIAAASFIGPVYDKVPNANVILAAGICLAGIGTAVVPLSTSVYFLAFIVMSQGVGMAVCDVGCKLWIHQRVLCRPLLRSMGLLQATCSLSICGARTLGRGFN